MASRPLIESVQTLVVCGDGEEDHRAPRTVRALARIGVAGQRVAEGELAGRLKGAEGAVWLVRAGAWPAGGKIELPMGSQTGRGLAALGAVFDEEMAMDAGWAELLHRSGGHLDEEIVRGEVRLESVYLEAGLARALGAEIAGKSLAAALREVLRRERARVIHWAGVDVVRDEKLRVAQVVTSLQIGGAERVVLDLVHYLPRCGVRCALVTTGRAMRKAYAAPRGVVDVSTAPGGRVGRMEAAARAALDFHADVVHVHLLRAEDLPAFRATGIPVVMTVHNASAGWPAGTEKMEAGDAALLVACSQAAERELIAAKIPIAVRTAWNGIDPGTYAFTPALSARAQQMRKAWGVGVHDLVLVTLANPRPQKRLERLPAILAKVREKLAREGVRKEVTLVIAGEASEKLADSEESWRRLRAEIARVGLEKNVLLPGAVEDVAGLLHASNVMVSMSAWEGLSLAHLEALAAGKTLVATEVGGTGEIARFHGNVSLLKADVSDDAAAEVVARALVHPVAAGPLHAHFHAVHMARRYAQLYPRAIHRAGLGEKKPEGLLLIANNFSTGGAQSSARRLLLAIKERGHRVRAAVIQEQPEFPTVGRQALEAAGVPVLAIDPPEKFQTAEAVARLLAHIDHDPPESVLFWNCISGHKILLADLLLDERIRCFDVSPGEMYFSSLERYFSRPLPGVPCVNGLEYGEHLAAAVVKYEAEKELAERTLGTRIEVIPNGIAAPEVVPARRAASEPFVLGTAARLSPQKKLEQIFEALLAARGRMPRYVFRIAGGADGGSAEALAYVEGLKRKYAELPLEWVGEVAETAGFLRGLDVFVMISEPAGCPNASLEAMAAGLAVVATDVGGASEQVVDDVTGRLVAAGNVEGLAGAIVEALRDPERLAAWGRAGWERVKALFSMEKMVAAYERMLFKGE